MNRYADFRIFLEQEVQSLDSIKLSICDSNYSFSIAEIRDTFLGKLITKDYQPPCSVSMQYIFHFKYCTFGQK